MSLREYITKIPRRQYRRMVVRVIEDACVLLMLCVGTAAACVLLSAAVKWLGVG